MGILTLRCVEIEFPKYRFPTTSSAGGEAILHIFKLECRDSECNDPLCNRCGLKALNKNHQTILDDAERFLQGLDFLRQVNFVWEDCL